MAILGAHQSIAGGFHKAVQRAAAIGCQCLQVFTKNTNQWRARPIDKEEVARFRSALTETGISCPLAHDSYLISLASPDAALWKESIDAMVIELTRAEMLGIPWVVAHPGSYTSGTETEGLRRVIMALDEVLGQTRGQAVGCLLETTAGQGTSIGWRFEHLAAVLAGVRDPDRLGVCFDTCHVFAAGYRFATRRQCQATMRLFDKVVGIPQIRAFHLNDSRRECGSRIDRHEHIGRGHLGLEPFRFLVNDPRFAAIPMCLETPKGREGGRDLDEVNLATLRGLVTVDGRKWKVESGK